MAIIVWNDAGIGDLASTGGNWVGNVAPGPLDEARFSDPGLPLCTWDIPSVDKLTIEPTSDTQVLLATDLTVDQLDADGMSTGLLDITGFDVEFDTLLREQNGGITFAPGSQLSSVGAGTCDIDVESPVFSDLYIEKSGGQLNFLTAPQVLGAASFIAGLAAYTVQFKAGQIMLADTILFQGSAGPTLVVESDSPGIQATIQLTSPVGANDHTSFTDIEILGGPIDAGSNSVDGGNNDGITFGSPAAPTCDTKEIRAVLLALCRLPSVADAAGVNQAEWAVDTGRVRVIAEETPGIPNRGRLPMVQILFAGWIRTPVISGGSGGGESSMLWTIRVHTGGVARQSQQELSECISQACLDAIRVPAVNTDDFPAEGGDSVGIHEIRAAWHVQDTSIAIDSNYCIPDTL